MPGLTDDEVVSELRKMVRSPHTLDDENQLIFLQVEDDEVMA